MAKDCLSAAYAIRFATVMQRRRGMCRVKYTAKVPSKKIHRKLVKLVDPVSPHRKSPEFIKTIKCASNGIPDQHYTAFGLIIA